MAKFPGKAPHRSRSCFTASASWCSWVSFLTLLCRLVLYSVIYGTLATVRGFLPKAADGETETKKKKTKTKKPAYEVTLV